MIESSEDKSISSFGYSDEELLFKCSIGYLNTGILGIVKTNPVTSIKRYLDPNHVVFNYYEDD
ncbi:hypothetical protein KSX_12000 [Ktedonospora formicarum]|uniref:Uncharacterized protein n=1 Tax=Ktedonospora formicarum TaxID=2778364 RepID=A0A8J3HSB4_9CHLR|nr:hypothetical protein KSX_12000 [Ktedonospora formicarum]